MSFPFLPSNGARPGHSILITLVAATLGGGLFAALGLPAAWMSGALVAAAVLAMLGFEVDLPEGLRRAAFLVLGISMGTAVRPETLAGMRAWPISLAVLVVSVAATIAAVTFYLRRVAGWDGRTAFYASAPGALTSVLALAAQDAADVRRVAFAQAVRLFVLIAALPGTLTVLGLASPQAIATAAPAAGSIGIGAAGEIALMAIAGIAGGLAAERLWIPGGLVFGAMIASASLHGSGLIAAPLPQPVLIPCFIVLGAAIGGRFAGTNMATLRHFLLASLGAFAVACAVSVALALAAATLSGEGIGKTIVAFAPGGLEAMSILAFAIGLDPAFVAAHHLVRFLLIALFLPIVVRIVLGAPPAADEAGPPK